MTVLKIPDPEVPKEPISHIDMPNPMDLLRIVIIDESLLD